jgi:hypothetical protein
MLPLQKLESQRNAGGRLLTLVLFISKSARLKRR